MWKPPALRMMPDTWPGFIVRTTSAKTDGSRAGVRQPRLPPDDASGASEYDAATSAKSLPELICASAVSARLLAADYEARVAEPCIGKERADLVLAGCAILEAMLKMWPCDRAWNQLRQTVRSGI